MYKNQHHAQYQIAAAHQAASHGRSPVNPREAGADSAPILARLHALRTLDSHRVLPELILILGQLPAAQLEVQARCHALRKLERAVVQVAAVLAPGPMGAPAGASAQRTTLRGGRRAALSLEQRLYAAMAHNCVHLLHELDHGQGFFSDDHARGRAWAIRVAFRFFSRELLYAVKAGSAWPAGAWLALHELFVYLVMRGSVRPHGESPTLDEDEFDPELAYKRLLLIGLVADLCGCARIDREVAARLRHLAADARLIASDGLVGESGLIVVDVGLDRPAQLKTGSLDDPFRGWVLRVPDAFHALLLFLDPFHHHRIAGAAEHRP
ncbi:hypothetical protein [Candidatus Thiodictyon syntrophicum]|jgi:hypothetical protein|uniref:Uncharacterized protein n=1 Tax=Candidatus Thiodictyon syntrophicum TaxID=1166950 RepID=A0A2K8U7N1_9GAMM|nr:hypothetical protein [Candidatus Thiodictyon syntrophicum]AUB81429.1 hypothetical protein THSYN_11005 [Candidatus Thiodictyon syntrophicum]